MWQYKACAYFQGVLFLQAICRFRPGNISSKHKINDFISFFQQINCLLLEEGVCSVTVYMLEWSC